MAGGVGFGRARNCRLASDRSEARRRRLGVGPARVKSESSEVHPVQLVRVGRDRGLGAPV